MTLQAPPRERLHDLYMRLHTVRAVATYLGVSVATAHGWLRAADVSLGKHRPTPEVLQDLYNTHQSSYGVADVLDVDHNTVLRWMHADGLIVNQRHTWSSRRQEASRNSEGV